MGPSQLVDVVFKVLSNGTLAEARRWETAAGSCAESKSPTGGRLPRELGGKDIPANAGDADSIPKSGRSPGEGSGSPLQYSCLENSMDGGAWRAPWGAQESDTTERLSTLVGWV